MRSKKVDRDSAGRKGEQLTLAGIEALPRSIDPLFFAILPDASVVPQIVRTAQQSCDRSGLKDRLLKPEGLHVSLRPAGNYFGPQHSTISRACAAAATVTFPAFPIAFDHVMSFRGKPGNHPFVLCGSSGMAPLLELHQVLGVAMTMAGLG